MNEKQLSSPGVDGFEEEDVVQYIYIYIYTVCTPLLLLT